jgi:hypothetical protein
MEIDPKLGSLGFFPMPDILSSAIVSQTKRKM